MVVEFAEHYGCFRSAMDWELSLEVRNTTKDRVDGTIKNFCDAYKIQQKLFRTRKPCQNKQYLRDPDSTIGIMIRKDFLDMFPGVVELFKQFSERKQNETN